MRYSCLFAVAVAACMLAAPAAAAEDDHPQLTGAVKTFHDVLSPNWHSAEGPERNTAACRNAAQYVTLAKTIAEQTAPEASGGTGWSKAASGLHDASLALGAYCASGHDANVVAGLTTLHDRFHDLMKAMPK